MPNPVIHTKPGEKIVCYLSTHHLYHVLPAAYNSLLAYTPVDHVYLFVEDDKLPYKLPANVTAVNISGQDIFPEDGPNYHSRYTYMILFKAAMTRIFPDADRVLILDVDTIVREDISDLWALDLDGSYFAAVTEPRSHAIYGFPYPNFGCVMLNLSYLRSSGMDDAIINDLNTRKRMFPEQDAFIYNCGQRFYPLPSDYNDTSIGFKITAPTSHPRITHYAGFNDWTQFWIVQYWMTHTTRPNRSVVYMGNRRYYPMLITAAKSLLYHSQIDDVYFLMEDDAFPDQPDLPDICHCVNVRNQDIFSPSGPNINHYYSYMTLMRAALSKVIPYRDTVLLLDPDTIVVDDIAPIWNFDIQYHYFAAVPETRNNDHTHKPYYNAGVMFMNLRKLREDKKDDEIIRIINTTQYRHMEQDVLNFFCTPKILTLPPEYNASFVSDPVEHPRINHYLSFAKKDLPAAQEPYQNLPWNIIVKERENIAKE